MSVALADRLDALLPQTQCTRCGYDGCRPYAEAIARGDAAINRCPPGGESTIAALAQATGRVAQPLDPSCGRAVSRQLATIDASRCIGCTLCIAACPVDAIIGAPKRLHAVVAAWCSGCELCVAPCPVDCIAIVPTDRAWTGDDATAARERHEARNARLVDGVRVASRVAPPSREATSKAAREAAIRAAFERARARRAQAGSR